MLLWATASFAQNAVPAASPAPRLKAGHARIWNLVFSNPTGLDLVLGAGQAGRLLQSGTTANFYASYDVLPLGHNTLSVYRAGDRQTPLKSFDVNVTDGRYYTVCVQHFPGGQLTAELVDDTPDYTKPLTNTLTVRQVSFISHGVVVVTGSQQTQPLEPGGTQTLSGLPNGLVSVQARLTASTPPRSCDGQVDFSAARHNTLFVVSDAHRILRLRVAPDGPSPTEEAEAAAAAAKPTP